MIRIDTDKFQELRELIEAKLAPILEAHIKFDCPP